MPGWVEHAMWWHVYPLGFVGAEPRRCREGAAPAHRFSHLTAWLDHVVELGLSGIALGPVFASQTHGYDTVDHLAIDARLGTEEDFDAFLAEARCARAAGHGRRRLQPRRSRVLGLPAGAARRSLRADGVLVPPRLARRRRPGDGAGLPRLRGAPRPRRAQPRGARRRRVRRRRDEPLARPRDRRLAARRGLRAVALVLGEGAARRPREAPRGLRLRRGAARGLRGLRRRVRGRLRHAVRAVEVDLELAQRRELLRARLDADPPPGAPGDASCR